MHPLAQRLWRHPQLRRYRTDVRRFTGYSAITNPEHKSTTTSLASPVSSSTTLWPVNSRIQAAEASLKQTFQADAEEAVDTLQAWWWQWSGQVESNPRSFSEIVRGYFDPESDGGFTGEVFTFRQNDLPQSLYSFSNIFPDYSGAEPPRYFLGYNIAPDGKVDDTERRDELNKYMLHLESALGSINNDLQGIVLSGEYGAKKADGAIIASWQQCAGQITAILRDMQAAVSRQLGGLASSL
jgi:hypothetical protein